jgi:hypothetical protein
MIETKRDSRRGEGAGGTVGLPIAGSRDGGMARAIFIKIRRKYFLLININGLDHAN